MNQTTHLRASLALAFAAAFAVPAAFAQDAGSAQPGTNQDAASTSAQSSAQPTAQPPGASPAKKTWADLDADHNGSLDKQEAAALPALAKVFDKADGNADGALTGDEYKAYLDANGNAQSPSHAKH